MPKQTKIFTIGGATFDIFVQADDQSIITIQTPDSRHKWLAFPHGEKVRVKEMLESYGGGATNTAVHFSRMGFDVCFVGMVGDMYGEKVFANLEKHGVSCCHAIKTSRDKTGFSTIINTFDGDRTLLAYSGANRFFSAKDLPENALKDADWIFLSHLARHNSDIPDKLLQILKKNPNIKLAWNPGHEQIEQGIYKWKALLKRTEVLFVNKEEASRFSRTDFSPARVKHDDPRHQICPKCFLPPYSDDVSGILKTFVKTGVGKVIITDGRNGAQASDGKHHYFCPVQSHKRVDTLGAGDAFASGVVSALINRLPLHTALLYGTINAGSVVNHPGAQNGILDSDSMERAIKNNKIEVRKTKL